MTTPPYDALEACLRAVLAWYEQPLSAASLRARVAHGEGLWSEETLREAADNLGLDVEDGRIDPALPGLPPLPALCYTHEGTALAVLAQETEETALVVDPERSDRPEPMALADLFARLNGNTLSFPRRVLPSVAGDEVVGHGRHGHWFWGPILKVRKAYLQVALAAFLVNIFAIASSIFSMIVYDRVIPNNAIDTLIALLIGVSIIFISDFIIRTLRGYFLDTASAQADSAIADSLFEQILDVQMQARRGSTGSLASTLKEFEQIRDFLTSATLTTFIDIPFAIIFIAIIWLIGGPIVWVPLLAIPVMIVAGLAVQPQLRKLIKESQEDGHHKHAILVETIGGLETIKSLGAGPIMRRRWQDAVSHQSHIGLKSRMLAQLASNVANTTQQFVQVGVVTVGAFLVHSGELGFGAIIAATILSGRAIAPLAQITQLLTRMNQTLTSYKSLAQLMTQAREHQHGAVFMSRPEFKGAIEFRNVTFTYPGASKPVLDGVSFQITPGETVAIVGKVGSGKTTVAKLILGLFKPDTGAVLIDGIDVRQIDPADLRRALGVVLQDVWLMGGTIRQNIALGGEHPTDADILHAAHVAGVEDFVRQHPEGYGLRLGERGEGLSGGQRQAIAIARALLGKPCILVFDEATSAMDAGAENQLIQRLKDEIGQRTFVTITHKAGLMQMVDKLIVLDQGRIVMQGRPDQILRAAQAAQAPQTAAPA
ncbi:MAG: type I secretion system permease/ATPase [Rhodocyclales bacterium]|nr:type I secretion system permease/ATPase [Rhodocyclales bacterium]